MTLNEAFAHAIKNDTISDLEMSWSLKITQERLEELLNGSEYNPQEELAMYRFVFKMRNKRPVLNGSSIIPQAVPTHEKSNGI